MDIISDRLKYDFDVYDSLPEENPGDYIQGFCYTLFMPMYNNFILRLENALNVSNAIAMIPTEYRTNSGDENVFFILYVLHKSYFEHQYFVYRTQRLGHTKKECLNLIYKETSPNPVYFHKGWTRPSYDPTKFEDPEELYKVLTYGREFVKFLPQDLIAKVRQDHLQAKHCINKK